MTPQAPHFERPDENGIYVMLAPAVAVDGRRSRVEIYGSWGHLLGAANHLGHANGMIPETMVSWAGSAPNALEPEDGHKGRETGDRLLAEGWASDRWRRS